MANVCLARQTYVYLHIDNEFAETGHHHRSFSRFDKLGDPSIVIRQFDELAQITMNQR